MLPDQRRRKLLDVLGADGGAEVPRLADALGVSPATVRRDLQLLASEGLLRRTHGGAVLPFESTAFFPHHDKKMQSNQEEKVRIAKVAAQRVASGDVVVLDSGTTTLLLARELRALRDLTIVTTDLKIALELIDVPGFDVLLIGGMVRPRTYNTSGTFAEQMLGELHANHTFLGADGIDLRAGLTNATVTEVPVKRLMMQASRVVTLVSDHSKFGRIGLAHVSDLTEFSEIVTGAGLASSVVKAHLASGVRLTVVPSD